MPPRKMVFVAMPFGKKPDDARTCTIDFDAVYDRGIRPALKGLDVDVVRADEERGGGIIHTPMFERLLLAEIAIVDVTIANPNVFYELGVRHTARPHSTILITGSRGALPFDLSMIRRVRYDLTNGELSAEAATKLRTALRKSVKDAATAGSKDSPIFQLIPAFPGISLAAEQTETFRDRVRHVAELLSRIAAARTRADGPDALDALSDDVLASGPHADVVIEHLGAYRALGEKGIGSLIAFAEKLPASFYDGQPAVREHHAFALNRTKRQKERRRAVKILEELIASRGVTSETAGLLGRIYKDLYEEAAKSGDGELAATYLRQAIDTYASGFDADPRDFYPGVNLVTLLAIEGSAESKARLKVVLPAVFYAVERLRWKTSPDYWLVATAFELAVLGNDWATAKIALSRMTMLADEDWKLDTTARNARLLREQAPGMFDLEQFDAILARLPQPGPPAAAT